MNVSSEICTIRKRIEEYEDEKFKDVKIGRCEDEHCETKKMSRDNEEIRR
jgi:hypothetical protein